MVSGAFVTLGVGNLFMERKENRNVGVGAVSVGSSGRQKRVFVVFDVV